jgi:hypothetical protein
LNIAGLADAESRLPDETAFVTARSPDRGSSGSAISNPQLAIYHPAAAPVGHPPTL